MMSNVHASMMVVNGHGILITGASGVGKSDLCLQLLDRGHLFVADDMVRCEKQGQQIIGSLPIHAKPQIAIRDIGIIDVEQHFGRQCICDRHPIHLAIHLTDGRPSHNPLETQASFYQCLDRHLPQWILTTAPHRRLDLLAELLAK